MQSYQVSAPPQKKPFPVLIFVLVLLAITAIVVASVVFLGPIVRDMSLPADSEYTRFNDPVRMENDPSVGERVSIALRLEGDGEDTSLGKEYTLNPPPFNTPAIVLRFPKNRDLKPRVGLSYYYGKVLSKVMRANHN
jgi:hypothetical protein